MSSPETDIAEKLAAARRLRRLVDSVKLKDLPFIHSLSVPAKASQLLFVCLDVEIGERKFHFEENFDLYLEACTDSGVLDMIREFFKKSFFIILDDSLYVNGVKLWSKD